jgi:hypothetical protein
VLGGEQNGAVLDTGAGELVGQLVEGVLERAAVASGGGRQAGRAGVDATGGELVTSVTSSSRAAR